ncbi:uncharacterized protein LOC144329709 [Macaca mulatta]
MLNLEEDLYWTQWPWASVCQSSAQPQCTEDGALPDALVSCIELCELFCPADPLALTDIDGDPGGRIALGLLALTQCPSIGCSATEKLKLWPVLVPWSPAQSSEIQALNSILGELYPVSAFLLSSSAQLGPLTLTRIAVRDMDGDSPEKACGPGTPGFDFKCGLPRVPHFRNRSVFCVDPIPQGTLALSGIGQWILLVLWAMGQATWSR